MWRVRLPVGSRVSGAIRVRSVQDPGGNRLVSPGVSALEVGDGDERISEIHGLDLTQPPPPPVQTLDASF